MAQEGAPRVEFTLTEFDSPILQVTRLQNGAFGRVARRATLPKVRSSNSRLLYPVNWLPIHPAILSVKPIAGYVTLTGAQSRQLTF
jgi:hypothetical protein